MMNQRAKESDVQAGRLVYVPSDTYLVETEDPLKTTTILRLDEPKVFLVLEESERSYRILHEGQKWFVSRDKSYEVENDS